MSSAHPIVNESTPIILSSVVPVPAQSRPMLLPSSTTSGPAPSITDSSRSFEEERALTRARNPSGAAVVIPTPPVNEKTVPIARALSFTSSGKRRNPFNSGPAPALLAESIIAHLADLESANASLSAELQRERIALSEVVCYSRRLQAALESCVQTQSEVEDQALRGVSIVRQEAEAAHSVLHARIEELEVSVYFIWRG